MIRYWNRASGSEEVEKVYGDAGVRALYGNRFGRLITHHLLAHPLVSDWYGKMQSSPRSVGKIERFISDFSIPMEQYENPGFKSFNDFFIRRFKPGRRPFVTDTRKLAAFSEGRYLGWSSVKSDQKFPVKGAELASSALLGDSAEAIRLASRFEGGPLLICRLCPVDYHRFHFPDDGVIENYFRVPGKLHSVNPLALQNQEGVFCRNERQVSILKSAHFGNLAYIEVGALMVGRIVQSHSMAHGEPFKRGDEKGYFLFGGSTVILLGEPGRWRPSQDILENTAREREVLVRLGDEVGGLTQ